MSELSANYYRRMSQNYHRALQHIADHCTVTDMQADDEWMGNDGDGDLAHLLEWIESNRRAVEPAGSGDE